MKLAHVAALAALTIGSPALAGERVTATDLGDSITTHISIASGDFIEGNPALSGFGSPAAAALVGKYLLRNYGGEIGRIGADISGAFGTCHNVAVLSGGTGGAGLAAGLICAVVSQMDLPPHEPETADDCERTERLVAGRVCM